MRIGGSASGVCRLLRRLVARIAGADDGAGDGDRTELEHESSGDDHGSLRAIPAQKPYPTPKTRVKIRAAQEKERRRMDGERPAEVGERSILRAV
jgi:hypothetical protein